MRLSVSGLRRVVKRSMAIEFGREQLSSYGGLELVRQCFEIISLNRRIRQGFREHDLGGDYGCVHLVVLVVGLLVVGARRLKQLRYVAHARSVVRPAVRSGARSGGSDGSEVAERIHPGLAGSAGTDQ